MEQPAKISPFFVAVVAAAFYKRNKNEEKL